jgi:microcystin-dependent protein
MANHFAPFHSGLRTAALAASALVGAAFAAPAQAETSPYLGEVIFFTGQAYSCPNNFALADGRLLNRNEYSALFALVGNVYGGDNVTTFALPDLRGRIIRGVGVGVGPNLSPVALGEKGGAASVQLAPGNIPYAPSTRGKLALAPAQPAAGAPALSGVMANALAEDVPTLAPTLVVSPCVALIGTFPSFN